MELPPDPSSFCSTIPERSGRIGEAEGESPYLFLVFQYDRPLATSERHSLADVDAVVIGRGARRSIRGSQSGRRTLNLQVPDDWMSSQHVQLSHQVGRWIVDDLGSTNGTFLNGSPVKRAVLKDGDILEAGHTLFIYRHAILESANEMPDKEASDLIPPAPGLATLVPELDRRFRLLAQVAQSSLSVLIEGETGTGKEVIARAVHALSNRPGPFVCINCAALPETLVEAELFGYRRGAFSNATEDRSGLVRTADRGTLFLDELADLPVSSQAKFLRVLQERQVVPLGGTRPIDVDVRLCAATHRELEGLVAERKFREDLLARLSGFTLQLPPLYRRREDLGLLINTLLQRLAPSRLTEISFSRKAARALLQYQWPLNIRELEKCLEAAVVLAENQPIGMEHLPNTIRSALEGSTRASIQAELSEEDARRREDLMALLREHRGNLSAVARAMGKARVQIRRWLKRYELEPHLYRRG